MSYQFPGMNPYLENPNLWPEVHHLLISSMLQSLVPQVVPKYIVNIEKRVYDIPNENSLLVGIPDVIIPSNLTTKEPRNSNVAVLEKPATQGIEVTLPMNYQVKQAYLVVREISTKQVITVIELLSPTNKKSGIGREKYLEKRQEILESKTHLVEIDLLRDYEKMPLENKRINSDYNILISRSEQRPKAILYPFNLDDQIPTVSLPLKIEDTGAILDLYQLLTEVYAKAGYDYIIDYDQEPIPPLQ